MRGRKRKVKELAQKRERKAEAAKVEEQEIVQGQNKQPDRKTIFSKDLKA